MARSGRGADSLRAHQLADRVGGLRAAREPVLQALLVEDDLGGLGLGVVAAHGLDDATVARRALVGDDYSPDRVLMTADAGQPHSYRQLSSHLSEKDSGRAARLCGRLR